MEKRKKLLEKLAAGVIAFAPHIACVENENIFTDIATEQIHTSQNSFHWTLDQLISKKPSDILLVTTSAIPKTKELQETVQKYIETVYQARGLIANYLELDSKKFEEEFFVKANRANISEMEEALKEVIKITRPTYVILLGNENIIPCPTRNFEYEGAKMLEIPSDSWYIDINGDGIVDEKLSIGRIANSGQDAKEIIKGLETAIKMHQSNGLFIREKLSVGELEGKSSPPYGICDICSQQFQFIHDLSNSDYIKIVGHGSPNGFYQGYGEFERYPSLLVEDINKINLQNRNPIVIAFSPCRSALLNQNYISLATEFIYGGASAFIGKTTAEGHPTTFEKKFVENLSAGLTIGETLHDSISSIRRASLENKYSIPFSPSIPTLRRSEHNS